MKNWFKKGNDQRGAVTIEATLALTTFLFMFIMIYSIITVCRTQAKIQVAINSTAKELSQYSYVYSITGLHSAMGNLADSAEPTKEDTNALAGDIADVFSGIQSIGGNVTEFGDVTNMMGKWDEISENLDKTGESLTSAQEQISKMAEDPQKLLFGMAKLFASEVYEEAKSVAAEAVSRVLTQKHLKRSEKDTAEAFCQSVGIVPGTYFFKESYFNGIDFSHSKLFPYGSDEIIIVANYKMKLIQLLPIPVEFHFTQTATTRGWMQGDGAASEYSLDAKVETAVKNGESIWNIMEGSEREKMIRKMGIKELQDDGYYGVSGETYIHAYNASTNTFVAIRSYNPLAYADSVENVDKAKVKEYLTNLQSQMVSNTTNKHTIKIKKQDSNGNLKTEELNCTGASVKKAIVVIPADTGLDALFAEVIAEMKPTITFEIQPGYGKVYETPSATTPATEGAE